MFGGGRNNLFGGRDQSPQPDQYGQAPPRRPVPGSNHSNYDSPMNDATRYGQPPMPPPRNVPRTGGRPQPPPTHSYDSRGGGGGGQTWRLSPTKAPDNSYTFRNLAAVSGQEFTPSPDGNDLYLLINSQFVLSARPTNAIQPGAIGLSEPQRSWMNVAFTDQVQVEIYSPFAQGDQAFLYSTDIEIGFASQKKITQTPYDQDELATAVTNVFQNQIFAPGQKFLMDNSSIPMNLTVRTVQLMNLTSEKTKEAPTLSDPRARGILTPQTSINFFRDPKSPIQLKASARRPAANRIVAPDFKFEDMGIGGLDSEFSTIFRRAFASRIMPPALVERMNIQHVKGILLYGPPGTGKTLMARQIGKMLNAREPKIINGPEVLNKYVGQSEENIRKLFADAEKEYKEKGDESGLHIIIFDELDAVCKQRGSGAGGGTGVGDSVVNQLLSKLDGVDQLNNILLIGMTNRMDMIDDALLRPGRLEVHMEVSLPDAEGRQQILKIHTSKMQANNVMDPDVDIVELARRTKNFSGAEIAGLVKSASSFAFNRHIKAGTMAVVSDDITSMRVKMADFEMALQEVKPAFGVSEDELTTRLEGGMIHYSPSIDIILEKAKLFVEQVSNPAEASLLSIVLHGPPGAGKTALATKIAIDSGYPFIKLISSAHLLNMNESAKVAHIVKVFGDAYKSTTSMIILDDIERIIEWVPIGPRFSNLILQALVTLLGNRPPKDRRLLIVATTTKRLVLQELDIWGNFDADIMIPNVKTYEELAHVMDDSKAFSREQISQSIGEIQDITQSREVGVGIKKVLFNIQTAKQDKSNLVGRFVDMMSEAVATGSQSDR